MTIEMPIPQEPYTARKQFYCKSEPRQIYLVDKEVEFPDGELITSRTDLDGVITHANESFVIMSGWKREELIGQPHDILRHPDMPRAAFANLWETISKGEKWHGYVKNLRKDGKYYWVYATVIPNIRDGKIQGYTSVRRRAPNSKIEQMDALYRDMRKAEQE